LDGPSGSLLDFGSSYQWDSTNKHFDFLDDGKSKYAVDFGLPINPASKEFSWNNTVLSQKQNDSDHNHMDLEPLPPSCFSMDRLDEQEHVLCENFNKVKCVSIKNGHSGSSVSETSESECDAAQESAPKTRVGVFEGAMREVFQKQRYPDTQMIHDPVVQQALTIALRLVLDNDDEIDKAHKKSSTAAFNLRMLKTKRRDQYIKKVWSRLRTVIYLEYKKPKTSKVTALNNLKLNFDCSDSKESKFENFFGKEASKGLSRETENYILDNNTIFYHVFNFKFFEGLRLALNKQTRREISVNLVSNFRRFLEGNEDLPTLMKKMSPHKKEVKKPFTYQENNTALLLLIDNFQKCLLNKNDEAANNKKATLIALSKQVKDYADEKGWILHENNFRKNKIISFLR
jgi:hypothetical protein